MRAAVAPFAAAALVAYWAAWTLAQQRALPWASNSLVTDDAFIAYGVLAAVLVGLLVGRWWVILLGATPLAVWTGLELAGRVAAYHEAAPPLTHFLQTGGWWPVVWLYVAPLAIGVVVRRRGLAPSPNQPQAGGS